MTKWEVIVTFIEFLHPIAAVLLTVAAKRLD